MATKKRSSKKSSTSKRKGGSSTSCKCSRIVRETGGSPGSWTQCRKKGRFVRQELPHTKGVKCTSYHNKGKTYRRCYKVVMNKLTGRKNHVPVNMNKSCS